MSNKRSNPHPAGQSARGALATKPAKPLEVRTFRRQLGLSRKQFARLTGASERAVAGWEDDKPIGPVSKKSLIESQRLCDALGRVMEPEHVGEWLDTPNAAFSGLKPFDLIERGEVDRLWRMIFEVESGALT